LLWVFQQLDQSVVVAGVIVTAAKKFFQHPNTRIKKALTMWAGANYLAIKLVVPLDNFVCIFYGFSNAAKLFFTT